MRFDRHDEDSVLGFRHSKLIPIDPSGDPRPVQRPSTRPEIPGTGQIWTGRPWTVVQSYDS